MSKERKNSTNEQNKHLQSAKDKATLEAKKLSQELNRERSKNSEKEKVISEKEKAILQERIEKQKAILEAEEARKIIAELSLKVEDFEEKELDNEIALCDVKNKFLEEGKKVGELEHQKKELLAEVENAQFRQEVLKMYFKDIVTNASQPTITHVAKFVNEVLSTSGNDDPMLVLQKHTSDSSLTGEMPHQDS